MPQAPDRIQPQSLSDYLEVMSKAVFQSGISWKVVESKWPETREAFFGFDPHKIAALTPEEIEAMTEDTRVIRHHRKIAAVVHNADRMLELDQQHGSFRNYLRSHGDFDSTLKAIRKEFKYMGPTGIYYFLYVVGEEVPPHAEFEARYRQ